MKLSKVLIDRDLFEEITFTEGISTYNSTGSVNKTFNQCTFQNSFELRSYSGKMIFNSCFFEDSISTRTLFESNNLFVKFTNCVFNAKIEIIRLKQLEFENCKTNSEIKFGDHFSDNLIISGGKFNELEFGRFNHDNRTKIELNNIACKKLNFHGLNPKVITICGGHFEKIFLDQIKYNESLKIEGNFEDQTKVNIEFLSLRNNSFENSVLVKFASINNLDLSNSILRKNDFQFQNVVFKSEVLAIESNLSGLQFNNVSFLDAKLFFDWSYLAETKFSNIIWSKNNEVKSILEKKANSSIIEILRSKTEVYRQLKKASIDSNNQIDKLKFQRNELDSYWKRVKIDKTESRTNRFLLRIDRLFSNFGQDYLRPIGWLLGVQLILCCVIWWREDVFHHYNAVSCSRGFEDGLAQYVSMIIPIFKTPEYWTGTSLTLSVIIRLFNALQIYHFIRAVHKFGKN